MTHSIDGWERYIDSHYSVSKDVHFNKRDSIISLQTIMMSTNARENRSTGVRTRMEAPVDVNRRVLELFCSNVQRFPYEVTLLMREWQLEKSSKILARVKIDRCNANSEAELEDWIDKIAQLVRQEQLCVELFQRLWVNNCDEALGSMISCIDCSNLSIEGFINRVIISIFPVSRYLYEIESELMTGKRASSTIAGLCYAKQRLARYMRVCERRNAHVSVAYHRAVEFVLSCLPVLVENEVRRQRRFEDLDGIQKEALIVEDELKRLNQFQPQFPLYPVHPIKRARNEEDDGAEAESSRVLPGSKRCNACTSDRHATKDCNHVSSRCYKCHQIGHISRACKNFAIKDDKGRVQTLVQRTEASTKVTQRHDRSTPDKLTTAEGLLQKIRGNLTDRNKKAAGRRKEKKAASGWVPKRQTKEHPQLLNAEDLNSSDDSDNVDEALEALDALEELVHVNTIPGADISSQVVQVIGLVNEKECRIIADSGASKSICSEQEAERLGLVKTNEKRRFRGLGRSEGVLTKPVSVVLGDRRCSVEFSVVNDDIPMLIGRQDLAKINVLIDPKSGTLVDRKDQHLIAIAVADGQSDKLNAKAIDNFTESDNELLEKSRKLYDSLTPHLSDYWKEAFWVSLVRNKDCWLRPKSGGVDIKLDIEATGPPFKDRLRPVNEVVRSRIDVLLDNLEEHGIIVPSNSPWGSNNVLSEKPDGSGDRLCGDFRQVNKRIKNDAYPVPNLTATLQMIAHHRFYAEIDLFWGFWNVTLSDKAQELTAFLTHRGLYQYTVLPFGLLISPGSFQRIMDFSFKDLIGKGLTVYFDNIIMYANSLSELLTIFDKALQRCKDVKLAVRLAKLKIALTMMKSLGHMVSFEGISPDPKKVEALRKCRAPRTKDEVRSFLGTVGYLQRFIPHFSELAIPLTNLLRKSSEFVWSDLEQESFEVLKEALADHVMLSAPRGRGKFVIVADASSVGLGSALLQSQGDELVLIEFASKKLTNAQKKWDTREREAYAIKWSCEHFYDYLRGFDVLVFTDHESLRWMDSSTSGRVQRWALYLQQFRIEIKSLPGCENLIADWMSRSVPDAEEESKLIDEISAPLYPALTTSTDSVKTSLAPRIPTVKEIIDAYDLMTQQELDGSIVGVDGLRYSPTGQRLLIPTSMRNDIMFWFHGGKYGMHAGVNRTLRRMKSYVWWPKMSQNVRDFVDGCLVCKRFSPSPKLRLFKGILFSPSPLDLISLDFVGPIKWKNQDWHFIVGIDHCSKYIRMAACSSPTAAVAVAFLKKQWLSTFGAPSVVLVDNGKGFVSKEFRECVVATLSAHLVYTSPYYPQGNAVNEASHLSINRAIKTAITQDYDDFDLLLADVALVLNALPNRSVGRSPFFILFGFEPLFPGWQRLKPRVDATTRSLERAEVRQRLIVRSELIARDTELIEAKEFKVGDWIVFVLSDYERGKTQKNSASETSLKYSPIWSLPCRVVDVRDKVLTVRELGNDKYERQVPCAIAKKLKTEMPAQLAAANLKMLQISPPVQINRPRHWLTPDQSPVSLESIISSSKSPS